MVAVVDRNAAPPGAVAAGTFTQQNAQGIHQ